MLLVICLSSRRAVVLVILKEALEEVICYSTPTSTVGSATIYKVVSRLPRLEKMLTGRRFGGEKKPLELTQMPFATLSLEKPHWRGHLRGFLSENWTACPRPPLIKVAGATARVRHSNHVLLIHGEYMKEEAALSKARSAESSVFICW